MDDDDFWGEQEGGAQGSELERERGNRSQQHYNVRRTCSSCFEVSEVDELVGAPLPCLTQPPVCMQSGYRDGIDVGKERTIQAGFDVGELTLGVMRKLLSYQVLNEDIRPRNFILNQTNRHAIWHMYLANNFSCRKTEMS